jgi:hypothetical protein
MIFLTEKNPSSQRILKQIFYYFLSMNGWTNWIIGDMNGKTVK